MLKHVLVESTSFGVPFKGGQSLQLTEAGTILPLRPEKFTTWMCLFLGDTPNMDVVLLLVSPLTTTN